MRGRSFIYSDTSLELAFTVRTLFPSSLRATPGFFEELFFLLGLNLRISHYFSLRSRARALDILLTTLKNVRKNLTDRVSDSTGLKIFGEGEWKIRTQGKQKQRTWCKYPVSVNPATHEVTAIELTEATVHDYTVLLMLLQTHKNSGNIYADRAYPFKQNLDTSAK